MKQGPAKVIQTNQLQSLVYCEATLQVRLTFREVEKFRYKNLHFVLLSFFLSFFFFASHNSLTKARKNTEKSPQFLIFHEDVPFRT